MKKNAEAKQRERLKIASVFKQQIEVQSKELGEILKKKKTAHVKFASYQEGLDSLKQEKQSFQSEIQERIRETEVELDAMQSLTLQKRKENKVLEQQKNSLMDELVRLNDWIITAKEEKKNLQLDIQKESKIKKSLFKVKKDLEDKISILEEERAKILLDTSLSLENLRTERRIHEQFLLDNQEKLDAIKKAIIKAEEKYVGVVTHTKKVEKDLEIYTERVKKEYESTFPRRKIKL